MSIYFGLIGIDSKSSLSLDSNICVFVVKILPNKHNADAINDARVKNAQESPLSFIAMPNPKNISEIAPNIYTAKNANTTIRTMMLALAFFFLLPWDNDAQSAKSRDFISVLSIIVTNLKASLSL